MTALLLLLIALFGCTPLPAAGPPVVDGVADLRGWDPDAGPIRLDGNWAFYWDELIDPAAELPSPTATQPVPGTWQSRGLSKQGQATYVLTLLLPEDAPELSLRMGSLGGAGAVWMNQEPLMRMGTLSADAERVREDPRTLMAEFAPAPHSTLVVQVANQRHRSSGIRQSVTLGTSTQMRELLERQVVLDVATITALLFLGLSFLFVFIARPQERTMLWFGTTSIVFGLRHGLTGGSELLLRLGLDAPWPVLLRIEYLLGAIALTTGYLSVLSFVRQPLTSWGHRASVATGVLTSVVVVLIPFQFYAVGYHLLLLCQVLLFIGMLVVLLRELRGGQRFYALILLISMLFLVFGLIHDRIAAVSGTSLIQGEASAPTFALMLLAQGITLAVSFARSLSAGEGPHQATAGYAPTELLKLLKGERVEEPQRGDQTLLELDILFVDIRGYATLSEDADPEQIFPTLNSYLARIEPPITQGGGFVSQYMGDGIMALFREGADKAVQAGVEMCRALEKFNKEHPDTPDLSVGMGMSSGKVTLGILGDSKQLGANIVGEAANQAGRVEGMTQIYGGNLIIDERTLEKMERPERYNMRELDRVFSKDHSAPLRLYEVTEALPERQRIARQANLERYARALRAYRGGNLSMARTEFQACLARDPNDMASQHFLGQISDLSSVEPDPNPFSR